MATNIKTELPEIKQESFLFSGNPGQTLASKKRREGEPEKGKNKEL